MPTRRGRQEAGAGDCIHLGQRGGDAFPALRSAKGLYRGAPLRPGLD
jgi:hypothetical protein